LYALYFTLLLYYSVGKFFITHNHFNRVDVYQPGEVALRAIVAFEDFVDDMVIREQFLYKKGLFRKY